jgi:uncharacterized protein YbjQ (UPF0145 family)
MFWNPHVRGSLSIKRKKKLRTTNSRCDAGPCAKGLLTLTELGWTFQARCGRGNEMVVTTTFSIEGHRIKEYKGIVRGIIVRSPTIAQAFFGGLNAALGGQIGRYTQMCEQARQQAFASMVEHAHQLGANAVIGMRYDAAEVVDKDSATEVLCYGTAVLIEPAPTA